MIHEENKGEMRPRLVVLAIILARRAARVYHHLLERKGEGLGVLLIAGYMGRKRC
jgi:hypothetical protein